MTRTNVLIPCLDDSHRYTGCVGIASCTAFRCWNGRRLRAPEADSLPVDRFDVPVRVERYTACQCPTCGNAVDLDGDLASPGGRKIERWTTCREGLWLGPVSIYNLVHRRVPLKAVGPCERFSPAPEMRPEVAKKRAEDRERTRRWKIAQKAEKEKAART